LFIVVNASLFVRPAEFVPELIGLPIYLVLILACLAVSFPRVLPQLNGRALRGRPITVCVVGLLGTVILSLLANLYVGGAAIWGLEFFKVVVYYLLFVGLVNSPRRIRSFLFWFACFCVVLTALAVLQFHGAITLPNLKALNDNSFDPATGQSVIIQRLQGTGIFNDPNDLCLVLVVGFLLCCYWLAERKSGSLRYLWLAPMLLFGYALALTHSRGGFLAFVAGILVYFRARFGTVRTVLLGAVALPVLFALFAGRQTSIAIGESTGQTRVQLWSEGLMLFRQSPIFGIGVDNYAAEARQVAHNSFLHCFTEMGFLGGMLFLGAFYYALASLARSGARRRQILDPDMRRLQPFLLAMIAAYTTGMLSLSVPYLVPTYTMLALATVFLQAARVNPPLTNTGFTTRLMSRMAVVSVAYLACIYVFVRIFIRWS
jgi:O-antigen ligase